MTRKLVKKLLGRAYVTCEELETILTDIECVLNSRPLAYVFTEDLKEPLPPSHLLFIIFAFWWCTGVRSWLDPKSDELTRRVVYLQKLIDTFWDSWSNEYLLQLRESRRKNTHDSSSGRIDVGNGCSTWRESTWRIVETRKGWKIARRRRQENSFWIHGKEMESKTLKRPIY